ncbi:MAG: sirohydrochlorin chelatase [Gemmatimonadaceae bacterium]
MSGPFVTRALVLALSFPVAAFGQAASHATGAVGTIIVAHGGGPEWNSLVREVALEARLGGPVEVSFLMGPEAATTRFQDLARRMDSQGVSQIVVVPLLVSSHSEHYQQIRYLAGLTDSINHALHSQMGHSGLEPVKVRTPIRVTPALDDSPILAEILAERARALATDRKHQAVFLVGHGPNGAEDYARWMENLRPVAESVRRVAGFADVRVDLVRDDAPAHVRAEAVRRVRELIELQHRITGLPVVVVPVLLSRGRVSRETFLADLAGLPVTYTGDPILPYRGLARWIEERVASARPGATGTHETRSNVR